MKNVTIRCKTCSKEIFDSMPQVHMETMTVAEANNSECSDCMLSRLQDEMQESCTPILDLIGDFTWNFGQEFFIETNAGNYIWSDPNYNGDNTLRKTELSYQDWIRPQHCGRDKGTHYIKDYCGPNVKVIE